MSGAAAARNLRAVTRLLGLGSITTGVTLGWLIAGLLVRNRARRMRGRNRCFRGWARSTAFLMGMRVEATGSPPHPPFILVANHLSYLDIVALGTQVDAAFVAKSEVAEWPLFGWASRHFGTIFIERENRRGIRTALAEMERHWAAGSGVVLFPEGTTTSGAGVGPFRPALLELAAQDRLPVHYATIRYVAPADAQPAGESICWWGEMPFFSHLFNVFRLGPFEAHLTFGAQPIHGSDRGALAAALKSAVERDFTPTTATSDYDQKINNFVT